MGSIQVSQLGWKLPSGVELFRDVSFSVGSGDRVALIGANGVGKTSLLRIITGEARPTSGTVSIDGTLGVMRQLVGMGDTSEDAAPDVRALLLSLSPDRIRNAAARLDSAVGQVADDPMRYAEALSTWGDSGGYDVEVQWDEACGRALGADFRDVADRPLRTLSGGEQKRLALEFLLRGENDVLVLDEPDNFLDVPAKRWLERELRRDAEDRAVRQPRPRAARRRRRQDRHHRGIRSMDARRRFRRLCRGQGRHTPPSGRTTRRCTTTSASASRTTWC